MNVITVKTTDGQEIEIGIPTNIPSNKDARTFQYLWDRFVVELEGHWKGPVSAVVPADQADQVADAMDFHGAIVDERTPLRSGQVKLYSRGYWAHGF
jgi:hypothetical protein